jgi:hypothetical protein
MSNEKSSLTLSEKPGGVVAGSQVRIAGREGIFKKVMLYYIYWESRLYEK